MLHAIILVILAMLVLSSFGCAAPARLHSTDRVPALRVMTFNIRCSSATGDGENHWSKRRQLFFRTVERFDPDLLGLQEVVSDQVDEIRDRFAKTHRFVGVGRDDGRRKGEFAAILFRTDRFELTDQGHFWLSESPDQPGSVSWDSALTRMASWVKLRDKRSPSREPLIFVNTHWDHVGETARLESAKLLRAKFAELSDDGNIGVIFTGDLNCTEADAPLPVLLRASKNFPAMADAYREVHPQREPGERTFHAFNGATAGSRIDFILHSPQFRATEATIDRTNENGRYPSDHFPITATIVRD
ncbi:endonuclease/exonuclease/phosphatase family protein [soil metagenome]